MRLTTSTVASNLTTASAMPDQHNVLEVEMVDEFSEVISPVVDVVVVPSLLGTPMATTVVSNDTISMVGEEEHLNLPSIGV